MDALWQMVLKGLDQSFDKATGIMRWLGQCARVVTSNGHAVAWHTPLGLPVIQPYRERVRASLFRAFETGFLLGLLGRIKIIL